MLLLLLTTLLIQGSHSQEWELVWEDNFDSLDLGKWEHEVTAWGGGNGEFQIYTTDSENSYTRDGLLFIKPTLLPENINPLTGQPFGEDFLYNGYMDLAEMYGYCTDSNPANCIRQGSQANIQPTMSARLRTYQRFAFKSGRAEIRAKMPKGDWLWPAMWMLPEHWAYGGWPMSGEIDIVEIIGNEDLKLEGSGTDIGIQKMGSTLHWGVDPGQNRWYLTTAERHNHGNDYGNNFHDYVIEWDENGIRWYIDGEFLLRVPDPPVNENPSFNFYDFGAPWNPGSTNPWAGATPMAPFDQDFHFILNVAVGGINGYIPDNAINRGNNDLYGKPWHNSESQIDAMWRLWGTRDRWHWTWQGEDAAMQVDYVRVFRRV